MDGAAALPGYTEAFESLSLQGAQFPEDHRRISAVGGVTYRHPRRGSQPVELDAFALSGTGRIYTANSILSAACAQQGVPAFRLDGIVPIITDSYGSGRLVWGFSGYSTPGYPYGLEANGLRSLFAYLQHMGRAAQSGGGWRRQRRCTGAQRDTCQPVRGA